jgi:hypothetical protein
MSASRVLSLRITASGHVRICSSSDDGSRVTTEPVLSVPVPISFPHADAVPKFDEFTETSWSTVADVNVSHVNGRGVLMLPVTDPRLVTLWREGSWKFGKSVGYVHYPMDDLAMWCRCVAFRGYLSKYGDIKPSHIMVFVIGSDGSCGSGVLNIRDAKVQLNHEDKVITCPTMVVALSNMDVVRFNQDHNVAETLRDSAMFCAHEHHVYTDAIRKRLGPSAGAVHINMLRSNSSAKDIFQDQCVWDALSTWISQCDLMGVAPTADMQPESSVVHALYQSQPWGTRDLPLPVMWSRDHHGVLNRPDEVFASTTRILEECMTRNEVPLFRSDRMVSSARSGGFTGGLLTRPQPNPPNTVTPTGPEWLSTPDGATVVELDLNSMYPTTLANGSSLAAICPAWGGEHPSIEKLAQILLEAKRESKTNPAMLRATKLLSVFLFGCMQPLGPAVSAVSRVVLRVMVKAALTMAEIVAQKAWVITCITDSCFIGLVGVRDTLDHDTTVDAFLSLMPSVDASVLHRITEVSRSPADYLWAAAESSLVWLHELLSYALTPGPVWGCKVAHVGSNILFTPNKTGGINLNRYVRMGQDQRVDMCGIDAKNRWPGGINAVRSLAKTFMTHKTLNDDGIDADMSNAIVHGLSNGLPRADVTLAERVESVWRWLAIPLGADVVVYWKGTHGFQPPGTRATVRSIRDIQHSQPSRWIRDIDVARYGWEVAWTVSKALRPVCATATSQMERNIQSVVQKLVMVVVSKT